MYALIREWVSSGLTQNKFFEQHTISMSTFGCWLKKYLSEIGLRKGSDHFIPVKEGHDTCKDTFH